MATVIQFRRGRWLIHASHDGLKPGLESLTFTVSHTRRGGRSDKRSGKRVERTFDRTGRPRPLLQRQFLILLRRGRDDALVLCHEFDSKGRRQIYPSPQEGSVKKIRAACARCIKKLTQSGLTFLVFLSSF